MECLGSLTDLTYKEDVHVQEVLPPCTYAKTGALVTAAGVLIDTAALQEALEARFPSDEDAPRDVRVMLHMLRIFGKGV